MVKNNTHPDETADVVGDGRSLIERIRDYRLSNDNINSGSLFNSMDINDIRETEARVKEFYNYLRIKELHDED
ncbi:hypothetical protein FACS1894184_13710 [Clostridia bacterium]|nr:hypothetical protein FACS1894184_13710 [Clostridia bacterium]